MASQLSMGRWPASSAAQEGLTRLSPQPSRQEGAHPGTVKKNQHEPSPSNPFPSFPPSSSLLLLLPTTYYSMSLPIMCCIIIKSGARQFATGDRHHLQLLQQQQRATPNQFCVLNTSIWGAAVVAPSLLFSLLVVIQIHVLWCWSSHASPRVLLSSTYWPRAVTI